MHRDASGFDIKVMMMEMAIPFLCGSCCLTAKP